MERLCARRIEPMPLNKFFRAGFGRNWNGSNAGPLRIRQGRLTLMERRMKPSTVYLKRFSFAALAAAAAALLANAPAYAGECPADKMKAGVRASGEMTPKDVTDEELESIDLGTQIDGFDNRRLRFRKLVVQPGGVVPWHDHTDRPALILTAAGEITEFRSDCGVGIRHQAGDISREVAGIMHWWKNEGAEPAVLYAADVKHD